MIKIDWTIWLQFANFFVLMAVLNLLLYRPLREVLSRRKETVEGANQKARDLEEKIQDKMSRYEAQLQEAKSRGAEERNALRLAAAREEADVVAQAHQNAAEKLGTIKARVEMEAESARKDLQKQSQGLALDIASKVLGRGL